MGLHGSGLIRLKFRPSMNSVIRIVRAIDDEQRSPEAPVGHPFSAMGICVTPPLNAYSFRPSRSEPRPAQPADRRRK